MAATPFYRVSLSSGVYESSVLTGKTYKTVNVPGASDSFALDLDKAGDVTYEWEDSNGAIHGALLHAAKYYKFNYPKAADTYGGGINDKSEIVGGYEATSGGAWQAFQARDQVSSRSAVGHLCCGWPTPSNRHSKSHI